MCILRLIKQEFFLGQSVQPKTYVDLSLISTYTFRLLPAKFFASDKGKLVKPIELDEKYL